MSNLSELYQHEGHAVLDRLHERTGANRVYLYQIATGLRYPSRPLADALARVEPRLVPEEMIKPVPIENKWAQQVAARNPHLENVAA